MVIKKEYVCTIPTEVGWNRTLQFAVLILCVDSTGCDELGDYFVIEVDTMIDIVCEVDLKNDWF